MRFRFKPSDETVEAGFRRIASETLDDALGLLRDRDLPTAQIVHRVRRHCKSMRGLLRIVRPVFPAYQAENVIFRDVAASLSAAITPGLPSTIVAGSARPEDGATGSQGSAIS